MIQKVKYNILSIDLKWGRTEVRRPGIVLKIFMTYPGISWMLKGLTLFLTRNRIFTYVIFLQNNKKSRSKDKKSMILQSKDENSLIQKILQAQGLTVNLQSVLFTFLTKYFLRVIYVILFIFCLRGCVE